MSPYAESIQAEAEKLASRVRSVELPAALHSVRNGGASAISWSGTSVSDNLSVVTAACGAVIVAGGITLCVNCFGRRKIKNVKKRKKPTSNKKKAKEALTPIPDEPAAVPKSVQSKSPVAPAVPAQTEVPTPAAPQVAEIERQAAAQAAETAESTVIAGLTPVPLNVADAATAADSKTKAKKRKKKPAADKGNSDAAASLTSEKLDATEAPEQNGTGAHSNHVDEDRALAEALAAVDTEAADSGPASPQFEDQEEWETVGKRRPRKSKQGKDVETAAGDAEAASEASAEPITETGPP